MTLALGAFRREPETLGLSKCRCLGVAFALASKNGYAEDFFNQARIREAGSITPGGPAACNADRRNGVPVVPYSGFDMDLLTSMLRIVYLLFIFPWYSKVIALDP